jgi:hypothetical protein
MADTKSLWIVGLILGVLTAAVVLLAGAVVHAHVDGRLTLDGVEQIDGPRATPAGKVRG